MTFKNKLSILCTAALLAVGFQSFVYAATPNVQTPSPVIHLQNNLDENANLGWCIDTVGRGFNDQLHAHSCKPRGGDVQFGFNADNGNIESVEFAGKCLTIVDSTEANIAFGLLDCGIDQRSQSFNYDAESLQFHPVADTSLCIVVGSSSRKAGPFMSRDLLLADCTGTDVELSKWIVK